MYEEPSAKRRLFRTYQRIHTRMHGNRASLGVQASAANELQSGCRESRACFYATKQHAILVWCETFPRYYGRSIAAIWFA